MGKCVPSFPLMCGLSYFPKVNGIYPRFVPYCYQLSSSAASQYFTFSEIATVSSWVHGGPNTGFTDKYSWIGSHSKHTQGAALLFDREYRAKPAYVALRNALETGRR